jgi:hypothetical protein
LCNHLSANNKKENKSTTLSHHSSKVDPYPKLKNKETMSNLSADLVLKLKQLEFCPGAFNTIVHIAPFYS